MARKRVFINFDYDHDVDLKNALVGQSRFPDSPFEITDMSIKTASPGWKADARRRIKGYYAGGLQPSMHPQPLILDKFVARALNANFGGWALRDNGWSGATCGRYLRLAAEMAEQEGPFATPAGVELALFKARP